MEAGARDNLLKRYRVGAGLTQEELAERAGYSAVYVSMLERGLRRPQAATIDVLAGALGLEGPERSLLAASFGARDRSDLVGRADELRLIAEHVRGSGPPVLLLAGEPGIGKTRLLREAAQMGRAQGRLVLTGGCSRRGGQEPFAPLPGALLRYVTEMPPRQRQAGFEGCAWLARFIPQLGDLAPELPAPGALPPEQEQRLMLDSLIRFLHRIGGPSGTLLLLDDLQWAGADTFDVLFQLADNPGLRLIGAYRDVEVRDTSPLSVAMGDLAQAGLARHHTVGPLSDAEAAEMVGTVLGSADPTLTGGIVRRAAGVPFYLMSFAQDARVSGDGVGIPWDVTQGIRRRLAGLNPRTAETLEVAAIAGRRFTRSTLDAVVGLTADEMDEILDGLVHARLIRGGPQMYRFTHDVVHEVIEGGLTAARRASLHRRIAGALEGTDDLEALAYHYARSDLPDRAAYYLERAGDRARDRYAHAQAEGYYRELSDRLESAGTVGEVAGALVKLGTVLGRQGRYDPALDALQGAVERYRQVGDREGEGLAVAEIAHIHERRGTPEDGIARLQEVRVLPFPHGSRAAIVLDLALAPLALVTGRYADQLAATERAAERARQMDDGRLLAEAEVWRGCALNQLGRVEEGRTVQEAAIPLAESAGDLVSLTHALNDVGYRYESDGEFETSKYYKERALTLAERLGDPAAIANMTFRCGQNAFLRGEWEAARALFHRSAEMASGVRSSSIAAYPHFGLALLSLSEGRIDDARAHAVQCRDLSQGGDRQAYRAALALLAECELRSGRPDMAQRRLHEAGPDGTGLGLHPVGPVLAETYLALGDDRARDEADESVRLARERRSRVALVEALRVRGIVTGEEADLNEAVDLAASIGYPYGLMRALQSRADLRQAGGDEGSSVDRAEAGRIRERLMLQGAIAG